MEIERRLRRPQMTYKTESRPVVLHVEDDDGSAYLFRLVLRMEEANIDVFRLSNGEDAVRFLTRAGIFADAPRPDVVVLDLHLPRKNGRDVLAEIRQQAELQDLPLIMFRSSMRREDKEQAVALGANHYIEKSADLDSFVAVTRQLLVYVSSKTAAS